MHANSPLTVRGRIMLVERIASGRPIAHVAAEMGVSRKTATKWWRRFQDEGPAGLEDRSSRPMRCPHRSEPRPFDRFLHTYNHHRGHTALGGRPPISATNQPGQHS